MGRAVWSLLPALVWLELGHPSCRKLGVPAGHGDTEPVIGGHGARGEVCCLKSGHCSWPGWAQEATGREAAVTHCADEDTEAHWLPSQSKDVVTLGQKLKTNGVRPRVRNLYPETVP